MTERAPVGGNKGSARKPVSTSITSARSGSSREMASREKRYAITMAIRMICFVGMLFVHGNLRWVLLAGAVFLPYIAVVLANQADTKTKKHSAEPVEPQAAPQLTTGVVPPTEVIHGELADDEPGTDAPSGGRAEHRPTDEDEDRWTRHDRVA